jgi:hypothetical protein
MRSFVAEGAPQDDGQNRWSGDSQRREETDAWLPGRAGQKRWEPPQSKSSWREAFDGGKGSGTSGI